MSETLRMCRTPTRSATPAYHGFAGAVVDSDDEDLSHMDSKLEKGKGRTDFETEEQWQVGSLL